MRVRSLVLAVAATAMLVPANSSAEHCDIPIYVFSTTRVQTDVDDPTNPEQKIGRGLPSAVSSAVGCTVIRDTVIAEEPPAEAHAVTDSDIVYPNSNRMSVRLLDNGDDPAIVTSATLTWAGETIVLDMQGGESVTGEAAPWLDSQTIEIDPADTLEPNTAVAEICLSFGECFTRTYRTITSA